MFEHFHRGHEVELPETKLTWFAVAVLSNTLLKLALTLGFGSAPFRRVASWGLAALAAGSALGVWIAG